MPRTSKIAKLPSTIREELNERLERADSGRSIVKWLNAQPAVKKVLRESFHSEPVSEQNLTNWRHTGFAAWQLRNDFLDQLHLLSDESSDLKDAAIGDMAAHASRLLAIHFAMLLSPSLSSGFQSKRSDSAPSSSSSNPSSLFPSISNEQLANFLIKLTRAVVALRRSDLHAARLQLLLDQSTTKPKTNPNTRPAPDPALAREIALIRSRRPLIEPASPLSGSQIPAPSNPPPPPTEHRAPCTASPVSASPPPSQDTSSYIKNQNPVSPSLQPSIHPDYEPGPKPLPRVRLAGHYTR